MFLSDITLALFNSHYLNGLFSLGHYFRIHFPNALRGKIVVLRVDMCVVALRRKVAQFILVMSKLYMRNRNCIALAD